MAEAVADDPLVVGEQHPDRPGHAGSHSSTRKPSPAGAAVSRSAEQLGPLAHAGQPVPGRPAGAAVDGHRPAAPKSRTVSRTVPGR